jgi:hypothetical protein
VVIRNRDLLDSDAIAIAAALKGNKTVQQLTYVAVVVVLC